MKYNSDIDFEDVNWFFRKYLKIMGPSELLALIEDYEPGYNNGIVALCTCQHHLIPVSINL